MVVAGEEGADVISEQEGGAFNKIGEGEEKLVEYISDHGNGES